MSTHRCLFSSVFDEGVDHIFFKVEILSNEDREWHESFSLVLGPDDPVEAVLGEVTTATVTILDQEAAGSLILPAPPIVSCLTWKMAASASVKTRWEFEAWDFGCSSSCFLAQWFSTRNNLDAHTLCLHHPAPTTPLHTHKGNLALSGEILGCPKPHWKMLALVEARKSARQFTSFAIRRKIPGCCQGKVEPSNLS